MTTILSALASLIEIFANLGAGMASHGCGYEPELPIDIRIITKPEPRYVLEGRYPHETKKTGRHIAHGSNDGISRFNNSFGCRHG